MKKILIIDDEVAILTGLAYLLKDAGYSVETRTFLDTTTISTDTIPDLLILDMLLSGQDGRDLCRELRARPELIDMPIIMISAHPNAYEEARKAGADDFLAKPFNIADLIAKVARVV